MTQVVTSGWRADCTLFFLFLYHFHNRGNYYRQFRRGDTILLTIQEGRTHFFHSYMLSIAKIQIICHYRDSEILRIPPKTFFLLQACIGKIISLWQAEKQATPIKCLDLDDISVQLELECWLYVVFLFHNISIEEAPFYWLFWRGGTILLSLMERRSHSIGYLTEDLPLYWAILGGRMFSFRHRMKTYTEFNLATWLRMDKFADLYIYQQHQGTMLAPYIVDHGQVTVLFFCMGPTSETEMLPVTN